MTAPAADTAAPAAVAAAPPAAPPPPVPTIAHPPSDSDHPAVRFASHNQEIEPSAAQKSGDSAVPASDAVNKPSAAAVEPDDLRSLAGSLPKSSLQESRLHGFSYEPTSFPPSRVRPRVLLAALIVR